MVLIAEEVVEEWLNQQRFFTIRGVKLGVKEMDILAIREGEDGIERHHYEVHASINPVSYVSTVPKTIQRAEGRASNSAKKRTAEELKRGVKEWIQKKFKDPKKVELRQQLSAGEWRYHFVLHKVRHQDELAIFEESEVKILYLREILVDLKAGGDFTASGKDLIDLMLMDRLSTP
ncbi:MAG: hypothetical protein OXC63_03690 [Aestuariivita sp.]|nr:hypothetical protein [Aestuariivita sp.]MCY4346963.1 hypothetical protein [Aestuariivita sp.]